MIKRSTQNHGFTLIELMMTVALLGIFFSVVYGFLNHNFRFLNQRNGEHSAYLHARVALFRVTGFLQGYQELRVNNKTVEFRDENNHWSVLINFDTNTSNPADGSVYYYYRNDEAGQIRKTSNDSTFAEGITEFNFEELDGLIKVVVVTLPGEPGEDGFTLSTCIRSNRGFVETQ